jgi:hypothetical protein
MVLWGKKNMKIPAPMPYHVLDSQQI